MKLVFLHLNGKRLTSILFTKKYKETLKNYHPVPLLPICGKILERLLFNEIFEVFIENKLISSSQSGFKPGDSCINQLLSITHGIYSSFDEHCTKK